MPSLFIHQDFIPRILMQVMMSTEMIMTHLLDTMPAMKTSKSLCLFLCFSVPLPGKLLLNFLTRALDRPWVLLQNHPGVKAVPGMAPSGTGWLL